MSCLEPACCQNPCISCQNKFPEPSASSCLPHITLAAHLTGHMHLMVLLAAQQAGLHQCLLDSLPRSGGGQPAPHGSRVQAHSRKGRLGPAARYSQLGSLPPAQACCLLSGAVEPHACLGLHKQHAGVCSSCLFLPSRVGLHAEAAQQRLHLCLAVISNACISSANQSHPNLLLLNFTACCLQVASISSLATCPPSWHLPLGRSTHLATPST